MAIQAFYKDTLNDKEMKHCSNFSVLGEGIADKFNTGSVVKLT